ncbi:MAG: zinc ribbon domain-containing protein [Nostoc sp.]
MELIQYRRKALLEKEARLTAKCATGDTPRGHFRENAGLKVVAINPNGTSQECSGCGQKVKKPLSQRIHNCPNCNISLCRDFNAAINIKNRGTHDLKAQTMSSLRSL